MTPCVRSSPAAANINAQENDRYDVITIAAVKDDVPMVKLAIELGGNAKAITSRYDGTALIAAAHLGHDGVTAGADLPAVRRSTMSTISAGPR